MKVSLNWLRDYVDINLTAEELVSGLISIGFDIESVENQAEKLNNFVIGRVLERRKHPNADKLSLCKVDIGTEVLDVVCGAPNVDAGQTICFAKIGAVIPNGDFEIKKTKIRGEFSEGMICSEREMNLGDDQSGIMVLENRLPLGSPFAEYLGMNDVIIDIGVTPNRGDLLSHIGVAREIGFLVNKKVKIPDLNIFESGHDIKSHISVEIDNPDGCNRYCGRFVKNVIVKESPDWLQKKLLSVGMRPINNVVDVTNFVMLECGQPLHAFDYAFVEGKKIVVKDSGILKSYTTLDGKERMLRSSVLLICDAKKPVGIAGIMGGLNSEIRNETKDVFIESAYFDPVNIRQSSKFLGLQTDSSYRFERGVDIDMVKWACDRAAVLIAELSGGEIANGRIDEYPHKINARQIELRTEYLNKVAGIELDKEIVQQLLEKIELRFIDENNGKLKFEIPYFRIHDLKGEIDLIEEAARLYGYDKIREAEYDSITHDTRQYDDELYDFVNMLRDHFIGRGFKEIITNSLISHKQAEIFGENYVGLVNPLSSEMNVLRPNLYTGALDCVRNNFNFKSSSLKLFEVGEIFRHSESETNLVLGIQEDSTILLTLAGEFDHETVNRKPRPFDIFDLKGEVQVLLEKLHIDNLKLNCYNYGDIFDYKVEFSLSESFSEGINPVVAVIFKYTDRCIERFDLTGDIFGCEINVKALFGESLKNRFYKEISKYPPVLRDLSVVVEKGTNASQVEQQILQSGDKLLKKVKLYDVYDFDGKEGKEISYTFSLEFSSDEKTLTDEEINKVQDKIIKDLNKTLNAKLRN